MTYVSNNLSLVEQHRQDAYSISERTAEFLAAGGTVAQLPSPPRKPLPPPRSTRSIPKPSSSAASHLSQRRNVRRCANSRRHYEKTQAA